MAETTNGRKYKLHIEKAVSRGQGSRDHQEDTFSVCDKNLPDKGYGIYCIFDGHGTDTFSIHASKNMAKLLETNEQFLAHEYVNALRRAFYEENELLKPEYEKGAVGGTTATVALIADGMLYLANVGDSRSVIGIRQAHILHKDQTVAVRLSKDHSFSDKEEKQRIIQNGGDVCHGRVRSNGHGINMTRALGDFDFKAPFNNRSQDFISSEPHIKSIPLTPDDSFLIIASDGLWGVLEDQELVEIIAQKRKAGESAELIAASLVSSIAHTEGSDNITIIILFFNWIEVHSPEKPIIEVAPSMTKINTSDKDIELYAPPKTTQI